MSPWVVVLRSLTKISWVRHIYWATLHCGPSLRSISYLFLFLGLSKVLYIQNLVGNHNFQHYHDTGWCKQTQTGFIYDQWVSPKDQKVWEQLPLMFFRLLFWKSLHWVYFNNYQESPNIPHPHGLRKTRMNFC